MQADHGVVQRIGRSNQVNAQYCSLCKYEGVCRHNKADALFVLRGTLTYSGQIPSVAAGYSLRDIFCSSISKASADTLLSEKCSYRKISAMC